MSGQPPVPPGTDANPHVCDVGAYLRRIGHAGPVPPEAATLRALHEAHVGTIPFENLDILLGRPILLDLPAVEAKLVAARRGGYCFEQNTLFRAVLESLGFGVVSLGARVRLGATSIRGRTHMALAVDAGGEQFLCDVGFGGDGLVHPLPLAAGAEVWVGGWGHRLHRERNVFVLAANFGEGWTDLYEFTLEPQYPIDFVVANHYTSTYPGGAFLENLTAQRSRPGRRAILRNRELVLREPSGTQTESVRDPEHLLAILAQHFGLVFPPGTRFAKPEF